MELEILTAVQAIANPVLDALFSLLTLGVEPVALLSFLWIYWNIDKERGLNIGYSLLTALLLTNGLKEVFRAPRPIGQEGVRTLHAQTATGWSFPSGHSTAAGTIGTSLSIHYPSGRMWGLCLVGMLLTGLSRVYLGVHWPKDVVAGLLLGAVCALVCSQLGRIFASRVVLYGGTLLVLLPFAFVARSADFYKILGLFAGFLLGALFEESLVNFQPVRSTGRRLTRFLAGLAAVAAVYAGGKLLLPSLIWTDALRYGMVSFTGVGLCPLLFKRMKA